MVPTAVPTTVRMTAVAAIQVCRFCRSMPCARLFSLYCVRLPPRVHWVGRLPSAASARSSKTVRTAPASHRNAPAAAALAGIAGHASLLLPPGGGLGPGWAPRRDTAACGRPIDGSARYFKSFLIIVLARFLPAR